MGFYQNYQNSQFVLPSFLLEHVHELFSSAEEFLVWQLLYLENTKNGQSTNIDELAKRTGLDFDTITSILNQLLASSSLQFKNQSKEEGKAGVFYDASPLFLRLDQLAADLQQPDQDKKVDKQADFKSLLNFFEESLGRLLSPIEIEDLQKLVQEVPPVLIEEAFKEAVLSGKTGWRYWQSILRTWLSEGIRTKEQVERRRKEWEAQKQHKVKASDEFKRNMNVWGNMP